MTIVLDDEREEADGEDREEEGSTEVVLAGDGEKDSGKTGLSETFDFMGRPASLWAPTLFTASPHSRNEPYVTRVFAQLGRFRTLSLRPLGEHQLPLSSASSLPFVPGGPLQDT